ncbi:CHAT domain-containing protein [Microcoleus sp. FACHB-1515]|uniref:CHAT domain-containing protein n=1 Tax=Cyanophyceae TaxID=3028117 RepID=UPI0016850371|nr:CHAT domain-containing protein [Microcoleus sp. FACHB-1515]MBD2088596.1 CHAT domain-containing protein [Microcoleus sp. FACHB-1515]
MKYFFRSNLLFALAIVFVVLLSLPLSGQTQTIPRPLSSLRVNPEQLEAAIDRGDLADAVLQLEQGWKVQLDEYYLRVVNTQLLSTDQIAQSLRQSDELSGKRSALVYAISLAEQLEVILLLPDGQLIHHREQAATLEAIVETTNELWAGFADRRSAPQEYLPAAQQLYRWMIAPLESELQNQQIDNLIFCLGAGLRSVPMAALHDGNQFLIEKYSTSLIPAFNLLDRRPTRLSELRVLAMGASEFERETPLPAVPLELAAIARLWQAEVFLNEQFTVAKLREQRSTYPFGIVHLATHAAFNSRSIINSYIQFWDRPLLLTHLRELQLLQPVVQLLVLSACRTALGDASAELGFAGLAVQSGAKAALASLWSVSDASSAILMIDFYQNLKTVSSKAEALRQTQIAMLQGQLNLDNSFIQQTIRDLPTPPNFMNLENENLLHPFYWAGFTMIGNPW